MALAAVAIKAAKGRDKPYKLTDEVGLLDRIAATVAAANSFQAVADEWPAKMEREHRSAVTMKKLRWLTDFINASIWKRQVPAASIAARGDHSKAEPWPLR